MNFDLMKAQVHGWLNAKDIEEFFIEMLKP